MKNMRHRGARKTTEGPALSAQLVVAGRVQDNCCRITEHVDLMAAMERFLYAS